MRKMYLFKVAMLIMAVSALVMFNIGCEKKSYMPEQTNNQLTNSIISDVPPVKPIVIDGRLYFDDNESFKLYMDWIYYHRNDSIPPVYNYNQSIGFLSMKEIYDIGIDNMENIDEYISKFPRVFHKVEIDSSIIVEMQASPCSGYILNQNGLIQIGNTISRISHNYSYNIIDNANKETIESVINCDNGNINKDNVIVYKKNIYSETKTKTQYSYKTASFTDDKKRIVARLKYDFETINPTLGMYIIYAETDCQKKSLGIWGGYKLSGAWVKTTGITVYNGYGYQNSGYINVGGSNKQKIEEEIIRCYYPIFNITGTIEHKGADGSDTARVYNVNNDIAPPTY